ncbi:IPT/TIG domain-containing protein, partial [Listeria monocytogenes]|nr:IPT/TIG domain-containing protein [Listeria monocytogenes]
FSNTTFDASGNPNSDQSAAHSNSSVFLTLSCTPAGGGSAPTVTAVSPTSGPAGGATSVAITGTGFSSVTAVKFGSVNAASFTVN